MSKLFNLYIRLFALFTLLSLIEQDKDLTPPYYEDELDVIFTILEAGDDDETEE